MVKLAKHTQGNIRILLLQLTLVYLRASLKQETTNNYGS